MVKFNMSEPLSRSRVKGVRMGSSNNDIMASCNIFMWAGGEKPNSGQQEYVPLKLNVMTYSISLC